jgi:hypothetical protein
MEEVYVYSRAIDGGRMIFNHLTSDQITSVHKLYWFLRRLKVIGLVETTTEQIRYTESGRPIRYKLKFVKYHENMKGKLNIKKEIIRLKKNL